MKPRFVVLDTKTGKWYGTDRWSTAVKYGDIDGICQVVETWMQVEFDPLVSMTQGPELPLDEDEPARESVSNLEEMVLP